MCSLKTGIKQVKESSWKYLYPGSNFYLIYYMYFKYTCSINLKALKDKKKKTTHFILTEVVLVVNRQLKHKFESNCYAK